MEFVFFQMEKIVKNGHFLEENVVLNIKKNWHAKRLVKK
jgi:hypothetical protein